MRVAKEGYPFIIAAAVLALIGWLWFSPIAAAFWTLPLMFCLNFFRDPDRQAPPDPKAIISPADGKVVAVGPYEDAYLEEPGQRVSIFMNVFDVHVNRAPTTGVVETVTHQPGGFLNAMDAKASEQNEQTRIAMRTDHGKLAFTQIAGLVARRIICYLHPDEAIRAGARMGLIRFGSRVDVVFPARCSVSVRVGDRVRAGETIIGAWS